MRKQLCPQRAPSDTDIGLGRTLTLNVGWSDPEIDDKNSLLRRNSCRSSLTNGALSSSASIQSNFDSHCRQTAIKIDSICYPCFEMTQPRPICSRADESRPRSHSSIRSACGDLSVRPSCEQQDQSPPKLPWSLADQYLDTMVMDDRWRKLCHKKIRQVRRKVPYESQHSHSHSPIAISGYTPSSSSRRNIKKTKKSVILPPTPPISPKVPFRRKSLDDSDSGFVSSSPSPLSPTRNQLRSSRKCPLEPPAPTPLIDISASMIGRSCLSCGCINTTCWRRTMGGIICNSCGLRYFFCLGC
jgi:hypothetical protein